MSFFNKKEEVIDLQLTQFGKILLSKGKFKPAYYQFFDDNVLYDSEYAGFSESQNDAANRIKDNSYQKTQYIFKGAETKMTQFNERVASGEAGLYEPIESIPDNEERENSLMYALYDAEMGNQNTPFFNISALTAPLTGSLQYYSGSNVSHPIPQLTCVAEYNVIKDRDMNFNAMEDYQLSDDPTESTMVFSDGTIYSVHGEPIAFDFVEYNTSAGSDSFEIEVFEIVSGSQPDEEILLPLQNYQNYFNILTDSNIPDGVRGSSLDSFRPMFVRDGDSGTPLSTGGFSDIYASYAEDPEECD